MIAAHRSKTRFLPPPARAFAGRLASRAQVVSRGLRWLVRPPTTAHIEWTALVDAQDDGRHPGADELFELALDAAARAKDVDLSELARGRVDAGNLLNLWPGEHYRFLAAVVSIVGPALVVEVGTSTGLGALAMASALGPAARLVTFDIVPWRDLPDTLLRDADFGSIEQRLGDLSDDGVFTANADVLAAADLIFLDGPKDGRFEPILHARLKQTVKPGALVVYDDIRLLTMIELWRSIRDPKFDATSLAHWTGTGLVRYERPAE